MSLLCIDSVATKWYGAEILMSVMPKGGTPSILLLTTKELMQERWYPFCYKMVVQVSNDNTNSHSHIHVPYISISRWSLVQSIAYGIRERPYCSYRSSGRGRSNGHQPEGRRER